MLKAAFVGFLLGVFCFGILAFAYWQGEKIGYSNGATIQWQCELHSLEAIEKDKIDFSKEYDEVFVWEDGCWKGTITQKKDPK